MQELEPCFFFLWTRVNVTYGRKDVEWNEIEEKERVETLVLERIWLKMKLN